MSGSGIMSTLIPSSSPTAYIPSCVNHLKGVCKFEADPCSLQRCPGGFHQLIQSPLLPLSSFSSTLPSIRTFTPEEIPLYNIEREFSGLATPPCDSDNLILIRHSLSEFNFATFRLLHQCGIGYNDSLSSVYQLNADYTDTLLHPIGEEMCRQNAKHLAGISFHTVFVSPMRRALHTAALLFESHPQKHTIKFILLPLCSESLSKVCDISNIQQAKDTFSDTLACDFNLPTDWQLKTLLEDDHPARQAIEANTSDSQSVLDLIFAQMRDSYYPRSMESPAHVAQRVAQAKTFIKEYIATNDIRSEHHKVGIVSHFGFLSHMTSTITNTQGRHFTNCEAFPFQI